MWAGAGVVVLDHGFFLLFFGFSVDVVSHVTLRVLVGKSGGSNVKPVDAGGESPGLHEAQRKKAGDTGGGAERERLEGCEGQSPLKTPTVTRSFAPNSGRSATRSIEVLR
jgi:hypothetical protein